MTKTPTKTAETAAPANPIDKLDEAGLREAVAALQAQNARLIHRVGQADRRASIGHDQVLTERHRNADKVREHVTYREATEKQIKHHHGRVAELRAESDLRLARINDLESRVVDVVGGFKHIRGAVDHTFGGFKLGDKVRVERLDGIVAEWEVQAPPKV